MKIIGQVDDHNVLVQMSRHEVSHIAGLVNDRDRPHNLTSTGNVVQVGALWNALHHERERAKNTEYVASQLEAMAKAMRAFVDLHPLIVVEKPEEPNT